MAFKKSNMALGIGEPAPTSGCAGAVVVQRVIHPLKQPLAAGDVLEIGVLPTFHYLVGARLFVDGVPAASLGDVKLVSGGVNDADEGRELIGKVILTDGDLNDDGRLIPAAQFDRGIGIEIGAAIAADPAKSIRLDLIYAQG